MTFLTQKLVLSNCQLLGQTIDSASIQRGIILDRDIIIDESIEL